MNENEKLRQMLSFALFWMEPPCAEGCKHVDCPEVRQLIADAAALGVTEKAPDFRLIGEK